MFRLLLFLLGDWSRGPCQAQHVACQIATIGGQSLPEALNITCNTSAAGERCQCPRVWFTANQSVWLPVTGATSVLLGLCPPGWWFPVDSTSQCVLSTTGESVPVPLECPPGFFCEGGSRPPKSCYTGDYCPQGTGPGDHRCPSGSFCPIPGLQPQVCPNGATCRLGAYEPDPCLPGYYCRDGQTHMCPSGSFCPFASEEYQACARFTICPEGSKSENRLVMLLAFFLVMGLLLGLVARGYKFLRRGKGYVIAVIAATCVAGSWALDRVLGLFFTLYFVVIVLNWLVLRKKTCPEYVSPLLVLLSLVVVCVALWCGGHPEFAVVLAGMLLVGFLIFAMATENRRLIVLGRLLMLLSVIVLSASCFALDFPLAVLWVCAYTLIAILGIILFCAEAHRQKKQGSFVSTLRFARGVTGLSTRQPLAGSAARPLVTNAADFGASPTATSRTRPSVNSLDVEDRGGDCRTGVSFRLEEVDFELHDGSRLLNKVKLKIDPGCRVAVMGPSGSGKSTLLAVLSGRASYGDVSGKLLCSGLSIDDTTFLKHVTGFVPQDDVLLGELTCEENICFQAKLRLPNGTSTEEIQMQVQQVGKDLDLTEIMQSRVGTPEARGVSGGQRKRVSIGMELVSRPLLLFADEPTSGLDSTTSHDVVRCMNDAAARLGTTVVSVIHQPRYETLLRFDDLVLLSAGGWLVYAGRTCLAVEYFRNHLQVQFPPDTNPADVMMDSIQPPCNTPEACADAWNRCPDSILEAEDHEAGSRRALFRATPPFFQSMLAFMDRSFTLSVRAMGGILINQALCLLATFIICSIIKYERLDNYLMQSAFAALSLMLLQAVAAQRIYGADLQMTLREANVGASTMAYFCAKDVCSFFEVTVSAATFTAAYGTFSGAQIPLTKLFASTWAFIYLVFGSTCFFSILMSLWSAQMCAVVASFIAFCVSGVYQLNLPTIAAAFGKRGWIVPALSAIHWFWAYLLTFEAQALTPRSQEIFKTSLRIKGYDLERLHCEFRNDTDSLKEVFTLQADWEQSDGWVCDIERMLMLGLLFRFVAAGTLLLYVKASMAGWLHLTGVWKFVGKLLALFIIVFVIQFLFTELYWFGVVKIDM